MSPSPASPSPDPHEQLFQRLVDRDPTAPNDFAITFLEPLIHWLTERNRAIHLDLIDEAAAAAILAVIRNPASYRPQGSSLEAYLRMSAQGDLRNLLHRERRQRRGQERLSDVELSGDSGKYLGRDDDPALRLIIAEEQVKLAASIPASLREGMTEVELLVMELMQRGVKRTVDYAEVCGYTDRPFPEQQRLVKQMKDRIKKRRERQGRS